ncbi:MAG: hypothetical protein WC661_13425 [Opitutaceae bacterium]
METQVAGNHQHLEQARQNALMALNIAIGQLQKYAGPDARVTAQSQAQDTAIENPWFTGVWDAANTSNTPLVWLVSGNEINPLLIVPTSSLNRVAASPEVPLSLDANGVATNGPDTSSPNSVLLLGMHTAELTGTGLTNGAVVVPGVPLNAIPSGFSSPRTVGRYAWWVGDQGVKASLVLPDRSEEVTYVPWDTVSQRLRIRQQISTMPAYFQNTAAQSYGFDPLTLVNRTALAKVVSPGQLAMQIIQPASSAPVDVFIRQDFHFLTTVSFSVLANTRTDGTGGLMQDLSLQPSLLGPVFSAVAGMAYMEVPSATNTAMPPITDDDSPRRRNNMQTPVAQSATATVPAFALTVAPVLTEFLLQFRVFRSAGDVVVRSRLYVGLWNPYTAAFVPPSNLTVRVTGLPSITVTSPEGGSVSVNLQAAVFGTAGNSVNLPFTQAATPQTDRASWLPGRMYSWVTKTGTATADMEFYNKTLNATGWTVATQPLTGSSKNLGVTCSALTSPNLKVELLLGGASLAVYTPPDYSGFNVADVFGTNVTTGAPFSDGDNGWKFAYGFRLNQPSSTNTSRTWLLTTGEDPRSRAIPASALIPFNPNGGFNPAARPSYTSQPPTATGFDNYLIYRVQGSALSTRSANYDAPIFELPRLPCLSVGELQHLQIEGQRPFAIGNSWGGSLNSLFDQYFFSGIQPVGSGPNIATHEPLPDWNLQPVDTRSSPSSPLDLSTIRGGGAIDPLSSRYLLRAGGFNINSASAVAWRSVLSGMRFSTELPFMRAAIDATDTTATVGPNTGSQYVTPADGKPFSINETFSDDTLDTPSAPGPVFCRFPQTAQETYAWSTTPVLTSGVELSRQAFRQGVRGGAGATANINQLSTSSLDALAAKIANLIRIKCADTGPFRTMEEFLRTSALFGGKSLLEKAIDDTGMNDASIAASMNVPTATNPGFSSLTLTQGDILSALAPCMHVRSDTFLVRTYGETLNPTTGVVEGRAWCEALVQRMPSTVDPADDIARPVQSFGRRFNIISFRWLTPLDL